ncbi:MAG: mechanosensitive ion channel family protein [Minwuia sp.]|uniref:mechanosensitive ion channel family protein n=1 Tax=Minwuia sp. TaxID=2493630 RepID=UPI003A88A76C
MRQTFPTFIAALMLALTALMMAAAGASAQNPALTVQQRAAVQQNSAEDPAAQPGSLDAALKETIRQQVREELDQRASEPAAATAAAESGGSGDPFAQVIDGARMSVATISDNIRTTLAVIPELSDQIDRAFILLTDFEGWPRMWTGILNLAAMLAGGFLVAGLLRRATRRILTVPSAAAPFTMDRLPIAAVVFLRDLVFLIGFVVTGFLISLVWFQQYDPMRIFLISYLGAVSVAYAGWVISGALFAPGRPGHRLIDADDRMALTLARWTTAVAAVMGLIGFSVGMIRLLGMPPAVFAVLLVIAGLVVTAITFLLVTTATANDPARQPEGILDGLFGRYRRTWLQIASVLFLLIWTLSIFSAEGSKIVAVMIGFTAFALAVYAGHVLPGRAPEPEPIDLNRSISQIPIDPEDAAAAAAEALPAEVVPEPDPAPLPLQKRTSLLPSFRTIARTLLGIVGLLSVLHILGVDMVAAYRSPLGQHATDVLIEIAIIIVVASLIWSAVKRTIDRFIRREHEKAMEMAAEAVTDEDGLGGMVTSRFGTLLPLIRGFILSVLAAVTVMVVLSSMGLDIGPLLAGAGVVGIAIGFGAQALVRDIISGIFFLIDDAFRVGEYVEFGDIRGQVEMISIRSMRLRHHRGAIHTIPFGELRSITNYNRDWAIYKQEFRLHYEVDTDKVRKIIKKVGLRLLEDPELGPKFIQPLKSQGVFKIEEGALIVRTKFMCKPREQFIIRKAVFQEVKNALYEQGIELAQRRVQIDWPEWMQEQAAQNGDGDLTPDAPAPAEPPHPSPSRPAPQTVAAAAGAGLVATENRTKPVYPDEP